MNNPEYIVIHHSLTKDNKTVSWNAIRKYHLSLGWSNIGYHYGIELIGDRYEVLIGRFEDQAGAHTRQAGMNHKSLGICFVGNYDILPPLRERLVAGAELIVRLMRRYDIPLENVVPHSKYATYKSCPGKFFDMQALREQISLLMEK